MDDPHGRARKSDRYLVTQAHFDPAAAVAVVDAMNIMTEAAQYVTTPILDSRSATFEARFYTFEAKVDARFSNSKAG
jgi:hypothetical protein